MNEPARNVWENVFWTVTIRKIRTAVEFQDRDCTNHLFDAVAISIHLSTWNRRLPPNRWSLRVYEWLWHEEQNYRR